MIRAALFALLVQPLAATAQTPEPEALTGPAGLYVSDTNICSGLSEGRPLVDTLAESGALALGPAGIEGNEYHCAFAPDLDFAAPDGTITTHTGYCEEPGRITPRLFTFRLETLETPRVTLYDGSDTPATFFSCPG